MIEGAEAETQGEKCLTAFYNTVNTCRIPSEHAVGRAIK
jgi:hypothetical protein